MTNEAAISTAIDAISLARDGKFDELADRFAPQLRALVSGAAIEAAWNTEIERVGAVQSLGTSTTAKPATGVTTVTIPIVCEGGELAVAVTVHESGALMGIQFVAPGGQSDPGQDWAAPKYADQSSFEEVDVELGTGPLAVPGTLSIPRGAGPFPVVLMLGGSGPTDRDSTLGDNKPLKDVAWGLASAGIAALRFDKVTAAHGDEVRKNPDFALRDEYIPAATAALAVLRARADIDASQIFVLGHSLGGTVAPMLASIDGNVAGLIILAGGSQPLQWAIVRQVAYIAALDPNTAAAAQPGIDTLTRQAQLVDSAELSAGTPTSELPLGSPATYWLSIRDYNPVSTVASLTLPILLLQGGRDYQATVKDDLALWQAGLEKHPGTTTHIYDADNHFFLPGSGPSSPAEYGPGQHVDPQVVVDIVQWIGTVASN
jgi:pimeloyl-ACP methyl ester carboxylesterase